MDDLPPLVFVEVSFSCANESCESYGIDMFITTTEGCSGIVCGACSQTTLLSLGE